ncbi:MAG: hypothetical protein IJG09_12360 [Methanobrevibacter sp.]|nr:hypothetical protein [Methanobrevibacter sp.]
MKFKKIMIVGLILLAILTIGAVSASDTSDNLAVSDLSDDAVEASFDDVDVLADDDYNIDIHDDDIKDDDDWVAELMVPGDTTSGNFTIYCHDDNGDNYYLFNREIPADLENDENWYQDGDNGPIKCKVFKKDLTYDDDINCRYLNLTFVKNNENLVDKLAQLFIEDDGTITFGSPYHTYVDGDEITSFDEDFCGVGIPNDVRGNFTVYRDDDGERKYFFNRAVPDDLENDPNWYENDFGIIECNVRYSDLVNTDDIDDGDEIVFAFMVDGQVYDDLSETYKFEKGDGYVRFNSIEHHDEPFWNPSEVKVDNPDEVVLRIFDFPEDIDAVFYLIISKDDDVVKNITFERWDDNHWVDYYVDKDDEDWSPNKRYLIKVEDLDGLPCDEYDFKVQFTRDYEFDENMDYDVGTIAVVPFVVNVNDDEEVFSDILNFMFEIEVPEDAEGSASVYVDDTPIFENKPLSEIQYINHAWRNGHFIRLNDLQITASGEHDIQLNVTYNGNTRIIQTRKNIAVDVNSVILRIVSHGDESYVEFILEYPISPESVFDLYLNDTKAGNVSLYGYYEDQNAPLYSYELRFSLFEENEYVDGGELDEGTYNGVVKNGEVVIGQDTFSIYDFYLYYSEDEFDLHGNVKVINLTVPNEFFNDNGRLYVLAPRYDSSIIPVNKTITELNPTKVWDDELNMWICSFTPEELDFDDSSLFHDWDIINIAFVYNCPPKYMEEHDGVDVGYEVIVREYLRFNIQGDNAILLGAYDDEGHLFVKPNTILLNQDDDYNSSTWVAKLYIDDYKASGSLVMTVLGSDVEVFNVPFENFDLGDNQYGVYGFNVWLDEMDLSNVQDKDILELAFIDDKGNKESILVSVQRTDSFIKFHWFDHYDPEEPMVEFHTFYGNLTDGDYDETMMGWHSKGNFVTVYSPTQLGDNDLGITIKSDDGQFEKELPFNGWACGYEYDIACYVYSYAITDELKDMPDGNFTVTYNYNNQVITHKRNKAGDWVSVVITLDDVAEKFDITVNDILHDENDVALSIIATDYANRMTVNFDLGMGYFSVYVNGTRLENLGTLVPWVEPEGDDENGYELVRIELPEVTELELFRLCTDNAGCPEVYFTLADLGITQPGTYNIKITHYPSVKDGLDYHANNGYGEESWLAGELIYVAETELINKDISFTGHMVFIDISAVDSDIVITLTDEESQPVANATISYSINGVAQIGAITDENGKVSVAAPEGNVLVTATYANAANSTTLFFPVSTEMTITNVGNDIIISLSDAFGNKLDGETITYIINNGEEKSATIGDNGQVIVGSFKGLTNVVGNYAGSALFKASTANATFDLSVITQNTTLSISEGNHSAIIILVSGETPVAGANITYTINGVAGSGLTDEQGIITIGDLTGEIAIAASFAGDEIYNPSVASATFNFTSANNNSTVVKVNTAISAKSLTLTYNDKAALVATLRDENGTVISGAEITFTIGKNVYEINTDSKGQASCNINLAPKQYTATISYAGNATYIASSATAKVTVYKAASKFTAKSKAFKSATKTKKYAVVLKANGKYVKNSKVTLKIGSKTYSAITNAKGKAVFKITKFTKKGKFTSKIKFAGNSYYKAASKAVKITIK